MADFSLAQIGEASGGASPQPGVEQPNPITAAVSFASGVGESLFKAMGDRQEEEATAQINKAVTRFSEQQMRIADLVDQGRMSSQEGRMRMRHNLIKAGGDNPNLSGEFAKAHETVIGTAGMGKVAAEGTEQEQAFFATQEAATKDGFVLPTMSQEEKFEATIAYQQFQNNQKMIEDETKRIGLKRAKVGLQSDVIRQGTARISQQSAQLSLDEKVAQKRARDALAGLADGASFRFNNISKQLEQQVDAGEIPAEEAVRLLDEEWQSTSATAMEIGRGADATYVESLIAPMRNLYELRRGYLTGETTRDVLDSRVDMELARQGAVIASDPENAPILATSRLVGEGSPGLVAALNSVAQRALTANSKPGGRSTDITDPESSEDLPAYFRIINNGLDKANRGSLNDEQSTEEINNNLNHILDSVGQHGSAVESPTELSLAVDLLSSQSYGEYVEKNGGAIDRTRARQARIILQEQYDNVVRPLIAEEWRNASQLTMAVPDPTRPETAGQTEPVSGSIRPFFSGGTLEFISTSDRADRQTQRKIQELNKKVAPVVERLVRMGAHLEQHRDYQRIYEANYAELFGDTGTGAAASE